MPITQRISVRNPPATRPYRMRATFPLPRGTDPNTLGNSFGAFQQYRRIARIRSWDIYEWMVWNDGQRGRTLNARGEPVDIVEVSDITSGAHVHRWDCIYGAVNSDRLMGHEISGT